MVDPKWDTGTMGQSTNNFGCFGLFKIVRSAIHISGGKTKSTLKYHNHSHCPIVPEEFNDDHCPY